MNIGLVPSIFLTSILVIIGAVFILQVFVMPFSKYNFLLTLVTTLALSHMLEAAVSMLFGVNVKSLLQETSVQSWEFWGIYITPIQVLIIASALIFLVILSFIIHSTSIGRKIRALSENPHLAESMAVSQKKTSHLVFIVGTLLAAYAGILVGYDTNMQPTMGTAYTIKAFAAMILGGLGNIWGTIVGSYILGFVENFSIGLDFGGYSIPASYKDAFAFVIILLMLLFRPQGLFGSRRRTV